MNKNELTYVLRWAKKLKAVKQLGGKCEKCGNTDFRCFDFHHVDGQEKENTVCRFLEGRWSIIEKEIKKCKLLCRNCHSKLHGEAHEEISPGKMRQCNSLKKKFIEIYGECKCKMCNYTSDIVGIFDFHHRDPESKDFALGNAFRFLTDSNFTSKITNEIEKCDLLCRNCHNIVHFDEKKFTLLKKHIFEKADNYVEKQAKIDLDVIREMLKDGKKQIEISKILKCSKGTISGIIKKNNLGPE